MIQPTFEHGSWTTVFLVLHHHDLGDDSSQALQAFRKFGFQLVIVATVQNATTIQPYIDGVVMVSKSEATGRNARPVANVATKTITDFTALRRELKVPEPV